MDNSDKLFSVFLISLFLVVGLTIFGVNYNECRVYENMTKAGYEQKVDSNFGRPQTIWVKVKNDSENLSSVP